MGYLVIDEHNNIFVFNTEEQLVEYLRSCSIKIRIFELRGINNSPKEIYKRDRYVEDFFGNFMFGFWEE